MDLGNLKSGEAGKGYFCSKSSSGTNNTAVENSCLWFSKHPTVDHLLTSQLGVHADDVVGRVHVALLAALLRMGSRRVCGCTMLLRILVLYLNSRTIIQNSN